MTMGRSPISSTSPCIHDWVVCVRLRAWQCKRCLVKVFELELRRMPGPLPRKPYELLNQLVSIGQCVYPTAAEIKTAQELS